MVVNEIAQSLCTEIFLRLSFILYSLFFFFHFFIVFNAKTTLFFFLIFFVSRKKQIFILVSR